VNVSQLKLRSEKFDDDNNNNDNNNFKEKFGSCTRKTYSLQKTAVLGTSHIIRKVLQCEA
jgi:hypothetical protein